MMEFPTNPNIDDTYTYMGTTWTWDGVKWNNTTIDPQVGQIADIEDDIVDIQADIVSIEGDIDALAASVYTKTQSDALYLPRSIDTLTGLTTPSLSDVLIVHDVSDTTQGAGGTPKKTVVSEILAPYGQGRRNLIDNAATRIAQRGLTSANSSASSTSYKSVDRWQASNGIASGSPTLFTDVVDNSLPIGIDRAFRYAIFSGTKSSLAAGDWLGITQKIEGNTLRAAQALSATNAIKATVCTFWAYASVAGTYIAEFQIFNSAGTIIGSISRSYTMSASTWTKVSLAMPAFTAGSSIHVGPNVGAAIFLWLAAGTTYSGGTLNTSWTGTVTTNTRATGQVNMASSATGLFMITNVQWEVGTEPTTFESLSFDDDLHRCMRYYQMMTSSVSDFAADEGSGIYRMYGMGHMNSTTTATIFLQHIRPMRRAVTAIDTSAAGTFMIWAGAGTATATVLNGVTDGGSPWATRLDVTTGGSFTAGQAALLRSNGGNTSYLGLSADL